MTAGVETDESRLFSIGSNGKDLRSIIKPGTRIETGSRLPKVMWPPQYQGDVIGWLVEESDPILVAVDTDIDGCREIRRVDIALDSFLARQVGAGATKNP